jgi:hypothetical protein
VQLSAPDDDFEKAFRATVDARNAFLTSARTDLGYDTKLYQLLSAPRARGPPSPAADASDRGVGWVAAYGSVACDGATNRSTR